MKITVYLKDNFEEKITSNEIEEAIKNVMQLSKEDEEKIFDIKNNNIIYQRPHSNFFSIFFLNSDYPFQKIYKFLENLVEIKIKNKNYEIKEVNVAPYEYIVPERKLMKYYTRTPIVFYINEKEEIIKDGKIRKIEEILEKNISKGISKKIKKYFNIEIDLRDEIKIIVNSRKLKTKIYQIKSDKEKGELLKVFFIMEFASSHKLPNFLGFDNHLGWGEINSISC